MVGKAASFPGQSASPKSKEPQHGLRAACGRVNITDNTPPETSGNSGGAAKMLGKVENTSSKNACVGNERSGGYGRVVTGDSGEALLHYNKTRKGSGGGKVKRRGEERWETETWKHND